MVVKVSGIQDLFVHHIGQVLVVLKHFHVPVDNRLEVILDTLHHCVNQPLIVVSQKSGSLLRIEFDGPAQSVQKELQSTLCQFWRFIKIHVLQVNSTLDNLLLRRLLLVPILTGRPSHTTDIRLVAILRRFFYFVHHNSYLKYYRFKT